MLPLCRLHELNLNFKDVNFVQHPQKRTLTTYKFSHDKNSPTKTSTKQNINNLYELIYPKTHPLYEPYTTTTLRINTVTKEPELNRFKTIHFETFRTKGSVKPFFEKTYLSTPKTVLHSEIIPAVLTPTITKWIQNGNIHHPSLPALTKGKEKYRAHPTTIPLKLTATYTKNIHLPQQKTYFFKPGYLDEENNFINHPVDFFNPTKSLTQRIESGLQIKYTYRYDPNAPIFFYLFYLSAEQTEPSVSIEDIPLKDEDLATLYKYGAEIFSEESVINIPSKILLSIIYQWMNNHIKNHPNYNPKNFKSNFSSSSMTFIEKIFYNTSNLTPTSPI